MKSRTFRWSIIPLMLLSLAIGWQDRVKAQANIGTTRMGVSVVDKNFWRFSYPKSSLGAEHVVTPTPTPTAEATPRVRPQVSSVGIILGAIVIVLIIIGGVIWSGLARGSLKR